MLPWPLFFVPIERALHAVADADARLPAELLAGLGGAEARRAADQSHGVARQVRRPADADEAANHLRQEAAPEGQPIGDVPTDARPTQRVGQQVEEVALRDLARAAEVVRLTLGLRMVGGQDSAL